MVIYNVVRRGRGWYLGIDEFGFENLLAAIAGGFREHNKRPFIILCNMNSQAGNEEKMSIN